MSTATRNFDSAGATRQREPGRQVGGRLLAITASGPIYQTQAVCTFVPLSSAMALNGELAARVLNPRASVVSSLAERVKGDSAHTAWLRQTTMLSATVTWRSPMQRVAFLHEALRYVRRRGADGNETVLAAAINGAWPYLALDDLEVTLNYVKLALSRSTFTDKVRCAVIDPNPRVITFLEPGDFKAADPMEWLAFHKLHIDEWRLTLTKDRASRVPGVGSVDDALGRFQGDGLPSSNPLDDPDLGLRYGDLPGGPSAGSGNGTGRFGGAGLPGSNPLNDPETGLRYGNLPGHQSADAGGGYNGGGILDGLSRGDFQRNGGPLSFGSQLGAGGGSDWTNHEIAIVVGIVATVVAPGVMGESPAIGVLLAVAGFAAMGYGIGGVMKGGKSEKPSPTKTDGKPGEAKPTPKEDKPAPKPAEPAPPEPKPTDPGPDQPSAHDEYSDPFHHGSALPSGDGGGGTPTTIWDDNGGGGTPTTIWDGDGGGGTPTTIWDDNGGGGNPTTVGIHVGGTMLTGSGMRSATMQVGPNMFVY